MGSGIRGNFGNTKGSKLMPLTNTSNVIKISLPTSSIHSNANETSKYFPFKDGLFGSKNRKPRSKPREIFANNPSTAASFFFNTMTAGGKKESFNTGHGKGIKATLSDTSVITYRPTTSSNGSPAVEITVSGSKYVKPKKYHFVQRGGK